MKVITVKDKKEIALIAGSLVLEDLKKKNDIVLGLATGSTPVGLYNFLVEDHKKNKTDWSKVTTFNLDEYVGIDENHPQSYRYFMNKHLFNSINIKKDNTFVPKGVGDYLNYAKNYDALIKKHNGIDLQILGLGSNGHIGFNEPPCDFNSLTSLVKLVPETIEANSRFFKSKDEVPKEAVSMGIKSIMNARKIILLANGLQKAKAIKELVEGKIDNNYPCTILQQHKNAIIIIDEEAASLLSKK